MKLCPKCGAECEDNAKFCTTCGEPFADAAEIAPAPRVTTKKEFQDLPDNKKIKNQIRSSGIISYICAGITLLAGIVSGNYWMILDAVILVVLGLLIHLKQSKICAILLLAYSIISVIISLVTTGTPSGYLIIIAGIFAVISTFKLDKAWKAYQEQ